MLVVSSNIFAQQNEQESEVKEVTIAGKTAQKLQKTGKNVKLLTQKDLEKYKGQNLNDVLDQVVGFQIVGNFNNQSEPKSMKIRGGKSANVMVLLDEVPLKDVTGNDYTVSDLRLIALENIESIEVLNGASSVLYGSNATVSVINIKTKKQATKKIEGLLSARGGSFSTFAQNLAVKGKLNKFNYQVSGFNEKSDGLSAAIGENFDKDGWEKQNIAANIGFQDEKFEINLNSGWNHLLYQYDYGAFVDSNQRGNEEQFYVGGNASFKYNKGKLTFNLRSSNTERTAQDWVSETYQDQYQYKGNNFFTELYNSYKINDMLSFVGGVQYEKQCMEYQNLPWGATSMEKVLNFDDTYSENFDAFLNAQFQYKMFHLDAGARFTNHSKFGDHWVYSMNPYIFKEFGNHFLKVGYSYATAFIAPTLYQNFGSLPYTLANFDLKPETNQSHEIDFNFGKNDGTLNFNASLFQRNEENIFVYRTVNITTYQGSFFNVDENKAKGFELGFDYQPMKFLKFGGNFSFVEKDKQETMLRQPKQRVNSFVEILPFSTTRINLSHQYVSKRSDYYYDSMTYARMDVENPSFHLFGLNVNQKINKNLEAYLNIGNLFNTSYVDIVGYNTKPRNYTIGASYKF